MVDHFKPLTPAQATKLRDQAKELSEKPSPTAEDRQTIAEIRAKLVGFMRRPTTPAIAETVRVQIALSAGTPRWASANCASSRPTASPIP